MKIVKNCFSYQWCSDYSKELGYTRKDLAKLLNCSNANVSNWLNGKVCPSLYYVVKFAKLLNCNVEDLIEEVE